MEAEEGSRQGKELWAGTTAEHHCPLDTGQKFVTTCLSSCQPVFLLCGNGLPGDRAVKLRARGHHSWGSSLRLRAYLCVHPLIYLPCSCHFGLGSALCHFQVACLLALV